MDFEKLRSFVGDNEDGINYVDKIEKEANELVEKVNSLETAKNGTLEDLKKFKQGNSLVKEKLGLEQLNEEALDEALKGLGNSKADEKTKAEIEQLKSKLDEANKQKDETVQQYENRLSDMALTNNIRDLGVGQLASTKIAEQTILSELKKGAVLDGDKIVYKNEDGSTVYNGTSIMTPDKKLEQMRSDENWKPFFRADVKSGGGASESKGDGSANKIGGSKQERTEAIRQKFKL